MTQPPPARPPTAPPGEELNPLLRRLAGRRALARLAILFERVWPALWPPLGVAGLFVCAALLDLPSYLPPAWHLALLAGTAAAIVTCSCAACGPMRTPDDAAADRRLERASGLPAPAARGAHRPAGAARPDAGVALWQAHLARTIRQVRRLRVGTPHPGLPRRDRYALRAGAGGGADRRARHRRAGRPCPLARRVAADAAAPAGTARDRAAGLDHPAGLHASRAGVPEAGGRRGVGSRRLAPDGQRHRRVRHAQPVAGRSGQRRSAPWTRAASRPTAT